MARARQKLEERLKERREKRARQPAQIRRKQEREELARRYSEATEKEWRAQRKEEQQPPLYEALRPRPAVHVRYKIAKLETALASEAQRASAEPFLKREYERTRRKLQNKLERAREILKQLEGGSA